MKIKLNEKRAFVWLLLIVCVFSALLKIINIDYSSLWIDEIYTMFGVHPSLTMKQIIEYQGSTQPPLFFIVVRGICSIWGYDAANIRLLSIAFATISVFVVGYTAQLIFKDVYIGIALALLTAFNRILIFYALDARFYSIEFCFSALTILFFYRVYVLRQTTSLNIILLAMFMALGAYFHHFGLIPPVFLFALIVWQEYFEQKSSVKEIITNRNKWPFYIYCLLLLPWLFNGMADRTSGTYWLKEIDILGYIQHGLNYPSILNLLLVILTGYSVFLVLFQKQEKMYFLLIIPILVILLPVAFSYLRFPILVPRYGIVMLPYIFILLGVGLSNIKAYFSNYSTVILLVFSMAVSVPGIYACMLRPSWFEKSHWREAGAEIKGFVKSRDAKDWIVYSPSSGINRYAAIDFYLDYYNPNSKLIDDFVVGKESNVILIEVESYYKIDPAKFKEIQSQYTTKTEVFGSGLNMVKVHYCHR